MNEFFAVLKKVRDFLASLPMIAKLLLAIFVGFLYGGVYRFCRGDVTGIVIGVIWWFTGGFFGIGWIVDVVTILFKGDITVLA